VFASVQQRGAVQHRNESGRIKLDYQKDTGGNRMITIKQAVINVCTKMYHGQTLLGYQFYDKVLLELKMAGNTNRPLSDTVLRRFREVRELCGMENSQSVSEYTKKPIVVLDSQEKAVGQKALF
jgi:hypothetical protein